MQLLFDENLSRKLAVRLSDLYAGSQHVADFGLLTRPDEEVWRCAAANGFILAILMLDRS